MKYQDITVESLVIMTEITLKFCVTDTISKSDFWDTLKSHYDFIK